MKRFVTYLYECERGNKSKNVGFIRVNVHGGETTMEVFVRNFLRGDSVGKIFVLIFQEGLLGIELEKILIQNGQSDTRFTFQTEDIQESGFSLNDIVGIGIRMDNGAYLASCWRDVYADEITQGEFEEWKLKAEEFVAEEYKVEVCVAEETRSHNNSLEDVEESYVLQQRTQQEANDETRGSTSVIYEKIDLSQIRDLPSSNWHLTTNSFLVHGFWNYGYLVLKKELAEDKETISLGVPGIFEKPEAVMAVLFGFPSFEDIPQEMATVAMNQPRRFWDTKKNQESKVGTFGSWFVELQS